MLRRAVRIFVAILALAAVPATAALAQPAAAMQPAPVGGWEGELRGDEWPTFVTFTVEERDGGLAGSFEIFGRSLTFDALSWDGTRLSGRIGEGEMAIHLIAAAAEGTLVGETRQGATGRQFTLRPIPAYPAPRDRVEAWGQDLDALATRFLAVDRSFSAGERAMFLEAIEATRQELPRLTDSEVIMRIAAAIALADNAHTRLYVLRNRTALRRLPIRVWWFSDGLRVVRTNDGYRDMLGCRIVDIAGTDVRHARDLVGPAFAGPPSWRDYKSTYSLTSPEALAGAGIVADPETIEFGVDGCGGAPRRTVRPLPLVPSERAIEAWWDLSPLRENPHGLSAHVLPSEPSALPLYLRNPNANYWFERLADSGILYLQFNRAQNASEETIAAFGERLVAELERSRPRALVLDLRFNTGGNLTLARGIMERLEQLSRGIPRFVITGRATFSAGITHVVQWRQAGDVTLVGEPVGDVLEFWAEGGNIRLPNSGLDAHFANGAHSYSAAPCPAEIPCFDLSVESLDPDLPATPSWDDYRAGRDPAMEAVSRRLHPRGG